MISRERFSYWWSLLDGRFHGTRTTAQLEAYYGYLRPRLDDDRFDRAARTIWAEDEHFPRPGRFIDAAPPVASERTQDGPRDPTVARVIHASRRSRWGGGADAMFRRRDDLGIDVPHYDRNGFARPIVEWTD